VDIRKRSFFLFGIVGQPIILLAIDFISKKHGHAKKLALSQPYLQLEFDMVKRMNVLKRVLKASSVIFIVVLLEACGITTPIPTATMAPVPSLTPVIPSVTPTIMPTITFAHTPDFCSSNQWQDHMRVLSEDLFGALEPGGPRVFDRILMEQNPAWANFQQEVHGETWSAGVTFHETAFGPELGTGVNPAVLLVTYGVEKNWELPANGDLRSEVDNIRAVLYQHDVDWISGKVDQSQYPPIANAATYALYRYFNGDLAKLEIWCRTYVQVYDESSLK
jgi:hypothetical protein